ncbi:MAG: spore coat U domain-containing protein [Porticoccaceae bacterium]|nr:spore coat U domain-containing protein [Porticoccaceae bacterium]
MNMKLKPTLLATALASAGLVVTTAQGATDTANMPVTITIQTACDVSTIAPTTLDFGSHGLLTTAIDATSTITVTCTPTVPYDIGLNAGLNGGGDTDARAMVNGTEDVGYQLYQEVGRATVWGGPSSEFAVTSIGTGIAQPFTVYGRVPPQATPTAGNYTDTILVTITY